MGGEGRLFTGEMPKWEAGGGGGGEGGGGGGGEGKGGVSSLERPEKKKERKNERTLAKPCLALAQSIKCSTSQTHTDRKKWENKGEDTHPAFLTLCFTPTLSNLLSPPQENSFRATHSAQIPEFAFPFLGLLCACFPRLIQHAIHPGLFRRGHVFPPGGGAREAERGILVGKGETGCRPKRGDARLEGSGSAVKGAVRRVLGGNWEVEVCRRAIRVALG